MRTINRLWEVLAAIARFVFPPPRRFTCGDCARNARCGLAPSEDCIYALMQMARDGENSRRPSFVYPAAWQR